MNLNGSRTLPGPRDTDEPFFDVNDDGYLAPSDALMVINFLIDETAWPDDTVPDDGAS
jgi:hypothetical protein